MATPFAPTVEAERTDTYEDIVPTIMAAFLGIAVFGWLVSAFLSGIHFWAIPQIPAGAELSGSLTVITSQWAYIGPVPLATLGAFYYLSTVGLASWWFATRHPLILKVLTPITATGVLASAYFVYLQLGPIGAICPFCMMSAGASVVLFGLELAALNRSTLPSLQSATADISALVQPPATAWPLLVVAMGIATLASFFGVTLAPVPGT